ncbi:DUF4386 domain-containing protein [Dokdonia sp.]|uniref:DUF4386 domain-containing protein n=1 Tax=Dokdonia sp. TaxID=2024995 RepID=UPI0032660A53
MKTISLSNVAIIAGFGLLLMVLTVPFAEFYIFPKLISENSENTANNIVTNKMLFTVSIFLHFITLICDIIVAWALYVFLKPVQQSISLLTAWFRIIYTAMYLVALVNLIKILTIINHSENTEFVNFSDNVAFYISSFKLEWSFGLMIFGIYLFLLGYLVYKAIYIPKIFGILLIIAGLGYLVHTLGAFLFPEINLDFLFFTFFGELVFMVWLLVKGRNISTNSSS